MGKILNEFRDLNRMVVGHAARIRNAPAPLRNLTLSLTYRCNARCTMCNIWENPTAPDEEVDLDRIRDLASYSFLTDLVSLSLTGGEPLLREDLAEVAALFSERIRGFYTSIVTNGLTPALTVRQVERILERTENEIWMNVSVDSLDENYTRVRGISGGERKVLETTRRLVELSKQEQRLNVGILYTLTPDNFDQALPVLLYAREIGVQYTLNVINAGDVFYQQKPDATLCWYREHQDDILRLFRDLETAGYSRPLAKTLLSFFPQYLEDRANRPVTCVSGFTSAFIAPTGDVYPCVPSSERYRMGNLFENRFDEIWTSDQARRVRESVNRKECNCLLTCETSNSLKFSPAFLFKRVAEKFSTQ